MKVGTRKRFLVLLHTFAGLLSAKAQEFSIQEGNLFRVLVKASVGGNTLRMQDIYNDISTNW